MMGANVGTNPVLDETGLKGNWNFDVKWSMAFIGPMAASTTERVTMSEAVDKQLGLKLEERQVPTLPKPVRKGHKKGGKSSWMQ
jgi:uncharacterized protein (TIGR03435 family)